LHLDNIFFSLSCEHPTLPRAEVSAILEAENIPFKVKFSIPGVYRIEAPLSSISVIVKRASMVFSGCREIVFCKGNYNSIFNTCKSVDWSFLRGRRFLVRVRRVMGSCSGVSTILLERKIGSIIYNSLDGEASVDLHNPKFLLQGVLSEGFFILGLVLGRVKRGKFNARRPKFRPFHHPSSLDPFICRLFVNLSRARMGSLFLDPFCGSGGFLIEAAMIGCKVIGLDVDKAMIKGCKLNMKYYGLNPLSLVKGDARHLPFRKVNCIATDPPYGRSASTKGLSLKELLADFFSEVSAVLVRGGHICIASPSNIDLTSMGLNSGFTLVETHMMRVHKSLTRIICVFKR